MPGDTVAKALEDKPELLEENEKALHAFFTLSRRRQSGFEDINSISFTEILSYCQIYGVDEIEALTNKICAADDAFVVLVRQKRKKS